MKEIEKLYKQNRRQYVNMMSSILGGDRATGEDVVQEAFTRAIKFYGSYNPDRGKLTTWFNKILFNALRDTQQMMHNQPTNEVEDFSCQDLFLTDDFLYNPEFRDLLEHRIQQTPNEKHCSVLTLFFLLGYTSSEINQIEEKVSVSNVTTIVTRFREKIVGDLKWQTKETTWPT